MSLNGHVTCVLLVVFVLCAVVLKADDQVGMLKLTNTILEIYFVKFLYHCGNFILYRIQFASSF